MFYYPVSGNCFPLMETRNWRNEQMVRTFLTSHSEQKNKSISREDPQFRDNISDSFRLNGAKWKAPPQMTEKSSYFFFGYFVILIQLFAICVIPTGAPHVAIFFFCHLLPFVVWIYRCLRLSFLSRLL